MKPVLLIFIGLFFVSVSGQDSYREIGGKVTHDGFPLKNVEISIKGTSNGATTNENGVFSLKAKQGDILVFTHLGMKTVEVILEYSTTTLNLKMASKEVELDEVVIEKRKKNRGIEREIEFDNKPDMIRTQQGIFNTRASGLSIRMIKGDELNPGSPTFLEAIRGQLNGRVTYGNGIFDEDRTTVYLRITTSLLGGQQPAIYDLDGVVLYKPPLFLTLQEIDRIAIIRGIGASGRYGRIGHGGVIVINTKRGKYKNPKLTNRFKDSMKLSRKRAAEAYATINWNSEPPKQLNKLYNTKTEAKALEYFEATKEQLYESPFDAIEAGRYFINIWGNYDKANTIWNKVKRKNANNAVILKALAYIYEENNDLVSAMQVYQAISSLRPNYIQSYRDLAKINAELDRADKALKLYAIKLLEKEVGVQSGIDSIIGIESHQLVKRKKNELAIKVKDIEETLGFNPIRVVMEWNHGESEFEMQCMNPPNYYSWKHTFEDNPERIKEEKQLGYSSKQFYLNKDLGGKWRFNLNYFGNKSTDPTYLMVTIYFDYGKSTQNKVLKVFRLMTEDKNMHLLTIDLDAKSISG